MIPPHGFGADLTGRLHGARTVMAHGRLDEGGASRVAQELLALAAASDEDVRMLFAMYGDDLDSAFTVHDVVSTIAPRVHMVAAGRVAGAGVVAFCGAPIDDRTCLPMAYFHLHAVRASSRGLGTYASESARDATEQVARARDIIATATGLPPARVEEDMRQGLQLDAREAETYGLVSRLTMRGEL